MTDEERQGKPVDLDAAEELEDLEVLDEEARKVQGGATFDLSQNVSPLSEKMSPLSEKMSPRSSKTFP